MQRWQGLDDVPGDWGSSVVTIGVFDGVHRGHQRIVGRAAEAAARLDLPVVVITFDPHPMEVVRPGSHPPLLCTVRRRVQLLAGEGCDAACVLPFTLDFSRLGPDDFVRAVLADRLHARWVVVGDNFRFGHRAAGDVPLLAELGEKYDFGAEGVPLLSEAELSEAEHGEAEHGEAEHGEAEHGEAEHGEAEHGAHGEPGVTISSSRIRDLLGQGDVAGAAGDLGRPHRVEGVVVRGQQRGRALGFPTANLETAPHTAVPADGVYAGWLVSLDAEGQEEQRWPAAISVGTNPTFDGREQTVEAYALDRDDLDLYGLHMAVDFTARLRGMVRFDSAGALTEQMRRDVDEARDLVGGAC